MGDRATIQVIGHANETPDTFIYLHWNGSPEQVVATVKAAASRMRKADAPYATARLIGAFHERIDGCLSLGVVAATVANKNDDDNGHYTVDLDAGTVTQELYEDISQTMSSAVVAEGVRFGS